MAPVHPALLVWDRPAGALALLLVLLAWLVARRLARPSARPTGALALWRAQAPAAGERAARRRLPRGSPWLFAALALGATALVGPRPRAAWSELRIVVDRSPSMYLPLDPGDPGAGSRLDRALAVLAGGREAWGYERTVWNTPGEPPATGDGPPAEWRRRPAAALPEPRWRDRDSADTVWLSDGRPVAERLRAGIAASGGPAVPGPVGGLGRVCVEWDGEELREVAPGAPSPRVVVDEALPEVLDRVVRAWADGRGLELGPQERGPPVLHISSATAGSPRPVRAGRDGWVVEGSAVDVAPAAGDAWLAAAVSDSPGPVETLAVVRVRPGRLVSGWTAVDEPGGDPAAFAVSWSELLDASVLPAPDVVALVERRAAGAELLEPPRRGEPGPRGAGARLDAWFAGASALAAAAYVVTRTRPRRRSRSDRPRRSAA